VIDDGSLDEEKTRPERIIGWGLSSGGIAIVTSKAFAVVEKAMGRRTLQYSESAIYAQLRSDGALFDDGSKQATATQNRRYKGVQVRVLILRPEALYGCDEPATADNSSVAGAVAPDIAIESLKTVSATDATDATPIQHQKTTQPPLSAISKTHISPTNRCSGVAAADLEHQEGQEGATPPSVAAVRPGVAAPRMPLSGTPLIPVINKEKIRLVLEKLPDRGPEWARNLMEQVEGFDKWPAHVQQQVRQAEAIAAGAAD
jgi:hypothetical protein